MILIHIEHLIIEWFIYLSLIPYMPPPTFRNPVPLIYFLTWKNWEKADTCHKAQTVKSSPPMTSCSLCGALCFNVNLCRNRRQHEENNIIWGSLFLGSRERGVSQPSPLLFSEHRTIYPRHVSLFTEKRYSSLFSPVHPEPTHPCILLSHQFPYPIHSHLKSTILYIYIMIIPDFFYCECFCAAPHPVW